MIFDSSTACNAYQIRGLPFNGRNCFATAECILLPLPAARIMAVQRGFSLFPSSFSVLYAAKSSVSRALQLIADGRLKCPNEHGYVFIHDGARPFLTEKILEDTYAAAVQYQACVAAVQSKDTVKISDGNGFALSTLDRRSVWNIQTPQVFETSLILQAYERLKNRLPKLQEQGIQVTDDASVVEMFTESRVKLVEASYQNIKITTPEDMKTAEAFLEE